MNLEFKNIEGYDDPTAYEAIKNVSKSNESQRKDIVYICSPIMNDEQRTLNKAQGYCRFVISEGFVPISTHLIFPQFIETCDIKEINLAMNMSLEILSRCDELWCFGKPISEEMSIELNFAKKYKIKVRRFTDCCKPLHSKEEQHGHSRIF